MLNKRQLVDEFCHHVMCRRDYNQNRAGALWWEIAVLVTDDKILNAFRDSWIHYTEGVASIESFSYNLKVLRDHLLGRKQNESRIGI